MVKKSKKESPDRREAILGAAQAVFCKKGFGAARIDDVARRASVAKGTIYLYFDSKEALFKALIESVASPPIGAIEALLKNYEGTSEALLRAMFDIIRREVLGTERRLVVQLVLTEIHRFPDIAEFYYVNVVSRALGFLRTILERGIASGEFRNGDRVHFPQLAIAPLPLAVLWQSAFERYAALDIDGFFDAHTDMLIAHLKRAS